MGKCSAHFFRTEDQICAGSYAGGPDLVAFVDSELLVQQLARCRVALNIFIERISQCKPCLDFQFSHPCMQLVELQFHLCDVRIFAGHGDSSSFSKNHWPDNGLVTVGAAIGDTHPIADT